MKTRLLSRFPDCKMLQEFLKSLPTRSRRQLQESRKVLKSYDATLTGLIRDGQSCRLQVESALKEIGRLLNRPAAIRAHHCWRAHHGQPQS